MNEFYLDLERGHIAEVAVANWFRARGFEVLDLTKNPEFWKKEIDIRVWDHDGIPYDWEIKADWNIWKTANVCLELTSKTGGKGWFEITESTHICFVDMKFRIAYIARTEELRTYVKNNPGIKKMNLNGCLCALVNVDQCDLFNRITV